MNSTSKVEFLSIPAVNQDEMPLLLPVPDFLKQVFHSRKQRQGIVYLKHQLDSHGDMWYLNSPELAKVLDITRQATYKMLRTFAKRGYTESIGIKYLPVAERLSAHGITYSKMREWVVIPETLNALFYNKSKVESCPTNKKEDIEVVLNTCNQIPPTFYNLKLKEQTELLIKWNKKDLWAEWCARPIPIKPLPVTFYNLTLMEKILQVQKWDESENWSMENAVHEWIDRLAREMREEREIAEYESFPDPELDLLKNQFKHRNCFKDFHGVSEYSGLRTCPIKIYGKETYL